MAAAVPMISTVRIFLVPAALALAAISFIQAAASTGLAELGSGALARSGLTGAYLTAVTNRDFRIEFATHQQQAPNEPLELSDELDARARQSFAVDPLEVSSLRTIALASMLQQDESRARELMRAAERISKRDEVINLWLAQDYARAGNLELMIASFDHALRTSTRVREFAIKPLVESLGAEESHAPMGDLLRKHPEWEEAFWLEFVRNPVSLANASRFFESSEIPISWLSLENRSTLYANLKRSGQFESLYRLASFDPEAKASADALSAGSFVLASEGNPLGWTTYSSGNASTQVDRTTGDMQIEARGGSFGVAADRVVRGMRRYDLGIAMAAPVPENASLKLVAKCADESERELGALSLNAGDESAQFTLSAETCPFASIELSYTVEQGRSDALIRIAGITLRPA